jgi:hypothetical protein
MIAYIFVHRADPSEPSVIATSTTAQHSCGGVADEFSLALETRAIAAISAVPHR